MIRRTRWVQAGPVGIDRSRVRPHVHLRPDRHHHRRRAALPLHRADRRGLARSSGKTVNWSAYLRDSWQIRPNLTLNAGLRYEEQRLRYAEFLQRPRRSAHRRDARQERDDDARACGRRASASSTTGRRKAARRSTRHWGRFYESIPMDINDRSFGGEVNYQQDFDGHGAVRRRRSTASAAPNGDGCLADPSAAGAAERAASASTAC